MSKRCGLFQRRGRDFYPTPRSAVEPLVPWLYGLRSFAEPCCGEGDLVGHLADFGFDCVYRGDLAMGRDALKQLHFNGAHCIITNPPHNRVIMHMLITHFLTISPSWLLIDMDWLSNKHARPFLPACECVLPIGRVRWIPGSPNVGKDNYGWMRFTPGHKFGPRILVPDSSVTLR